MIQQLRGNNPVLLEDGTFVNLILNASDAHQEVPTRQNPISVPPHTFLHCVRMSTDPEVRATWELVPKSEATGQKWWYEYQQGQYVLVEKGTTAPVQCPTPDYQ